MARLAEVLVELEDTPHVGLVVLLVLGVDGIELTSGAAGSEERRMEEPSEAFEGAAKCGCGHIKVVVRVRSGGVRIRVTVVLVQILGGELEQQIDQSGLPTSEYSFSFGYCSVPCRSSL